MGTDRSRYGLLVSALGAIVLAVSVFLPWYGISFTASGISAVQSIGDEVASQLGNSSLQGSLGAFHTSISSMAGHDFLSISGHDAMKNLSIVLLVLAGLAILDALFPLARGGGPVPDGAGRSVVLLGCVACACVVYRMFNPPNPAGELLAMSVREGAWLALLGSLTMVIGGLWPRYSSLSGLEAGSRETFSLLSGWTPQS